MRFGDEVEEKKSRSLYTMSASSVCPSVRSIVERTNAITLPPGAKFAPAVSKNMLFWPSVASRAGGTCPGAPVYSTGFTVK